MSQHTVLHASLINLGIWNYCLNWNCYPIIFKSSSNFNNRSSKIWKIGTDSRIDWLKVKIGTKTHFHWLTENLLRYREDRHF